MAFSIERQQGTACQAGVGRVFCLKTSLVGPDLQTEWCVLAQAGRVGSCNVFMSTLEHAALTSVRAIVVCVS